MNQFKPGDLVAIKSRRIGAEVLSIDGDRVTVKIAMLDVSNLKAGPKITEETFDKEDLYHLNKTKGVIKL